MTASHLKLTQGQNRKIKRSAENAERAGKASKESEDPEGAPKRNQSENRKGTGDRMGEFRRAITQEQKMQRRQKILDAARELFAESDFASVKITDIAKKTGLGKGSVFLYFQSKEDLFLELTMQEFDAWYQKIQFLLLEEQGTGMGGKELLELLDRTFLSRDILIRLLVTAMTVLEQNAGYEQAVSYKRELHEEIRQLGETLDRRVIYFREGDGAQFLLRCLTLLAGIYQMSNPSEVVRQAVDCEELTLFQMDFRSSYLEMLQIILNGMMVQLL